MPGQPFRLPPRAPVQAYQTYAMKAKRRPATCAEVDCEPHLKGWVTIVPSDGDHALFIRAGKTGRVFIENRVPLDAGMAEFHFPAGQACFRASEHRVPVDAPGLYVVRGGDWRQNLGVIRRHVRGADFVEDFAEHQQSIVDRQKKG